MHLDLSNVAPIERYKLLTATVTPRPIALVSSLDSDGVVNAAPFSFFNVFAEEPALLMLGFDKRKSDGGTKHTVDNILTRNDFVVNLVDEAIAEPMARCAAELPRGVSELPFAGLTTAPSIKVETPRIAEAPFSLECRVYQRIRVSEKRDLLLGEIVCLVARDGLIDPETLKIEASLFRPVGRLYANQYARQNDRFALDAPSFKTLDADKT